MPDRTLSADAQPGDVAVWIPQRGQPRAVLLRERKEDGTGWWVTHLDGDLTTGLADFVLDDEVSPNPWRIVTAQQVADASG